MIILSSSWLSSFFLTSCLTNVRTRKLIGRTKFLILSRLNILGGRGGRKGGERKRGRGGGEGGWGGGREDTFYSVVKRSELVQFAKWAETTKKCRARLKPTLLLLHVSLYFSPPLPLLLPPLLPPSPPLSPSHSHYLCQPCYPVCKSASSAKLLTIDT